MSNAAQRVLRTLTRTAAIVALLAGTASAQKLSPFKEEPKPPPTQEEIEKQKKLDSTYKATLDKLPAQKSVDPWGNVRPPAPKPSKARQP